MNGATKSEPRPWRAIHGASGRDIYGTEERCKAWARCLEGAQVVDHNGFVRWATRDGRLWKV